MLLEENRRKHAENIRSEDEKLKRESQQKGLNMETPAEPSLPGAVVEDVVAPASNETVMDISGLEVIGTSMQIEPSSTSGDPHMNINEEGYLENVNLKKELNSNSETWPNNVRDELVLQDIDDNDVLPDVTLPSTGLSNSAVVTSDTSNAESCVQDSKRGASRFGRLKRRIRSLFSCFRRNQVTPVDF